MEQFKNALIALLSKIDTVAVNNDPENAARLDEAKADAAALLASFDDALTRTIDAEVLTVTNEKQVLQSQLTEAQAQLTEAQAQLTEAETAQPEAPRGGGLDFSMFGNMVSGEGVGAGR